MNPVVVAVSIGASLAFLNSLGKKNDDGEGERSGDDGDGFLDMRNNKVFIPLDKAKSLVIPGSTVEGARIQKEMAEVNSYLVNVLFALANRWDIKLSVDLTSAKNNRTTVFRYYPKTHTWSARFGSSVSGGKDVGGGFESGPVSVTTTSGHPTSAKGWPISENSEGVLDPWKGHGFSFYRITMTTEAGGTGDKRESMHVVLCPAMKEIHAWTNGTWSISSDGALTFYFIRPDGSETRGFLDPETDAAFEKLRSGYLKSSLKDAVPFGTIAYIVAAAVVTYFGGPVLGAAAGRVTQNLTNSALDVIDGNKDISDFALETLSAGISEMLDKEDSANLNKISQQYKELPDFQKNDINGLVRNYLTDYQSSGSI